MNARNLLLKTLTFFAIVFSTFFATQAVAGLFVNNQNATSGVWPKGQITFYNDTGFNKSLKLAMAQWERTGIPIRFVETNSRNADLMIVDDERELKEDCADGSTCGGLASLGYVHDFQSRMVLLPAGRRENHIVDFEYVQIIVHELGHVLGLGHNDKNCSIMFPTSNSCLTERKPLANSKGTVFFSGPNQSDVDSVRRLYGLPESDEYKTDGYSIDHRATAKYLLNIAD